MKTAKSIDYLYVKYIQWESVLHQLCHDIILLCEDCKVYCQVWRLQSLLSGQLPQKGYSCCTTVSARPLQRLSWTPAKDDGIPVEEDPVKHCERVAEGPIFKHTLGRRIQSWFQIGEGGLNCKPVCLFIIATSPVSNHSYIRHSGTGKSKGNTSVGLISKECN